MKKITKQESQSTNQNNCDANESFKLIDHHDNDDDDDQQSNNSVNGEFCDNKRKHSKWNLG